MATGFVLTSRRWVLGVAWVLIPLLAQVHTAHASLATGGDITTNYTVSGTNYRAHIFTTLGTNSLNVTGTGTVEVLVVAGGGGGGSGGGGAGGFLATSTNIAATGTVAVTVGVGGTAGSATVHGGNGSNSMFGALTALGGGGGTLHDTATGKNGGSGGGAGAASGALTYVGGFGTAGQGNNGGSISNKLTPWGAGGGGGAGAPGSNCVAAGISGRGGIGISSSLSGNSVMYAGGGGGAYYTGTAGTDGAGGAGGGGGGGAGGTNGTANTGGGGGGARNGAYTAGAGGSGIVIVRYSRGLTVDALPASGVSTNGATLNGTLAFTNSAGNADVYFCWGLTDAGTNSLGGWDHYSLLATNAGVGPVSTNLTGLLNGSGYVYRCFASNSAEIAWSDPQTFTMIPLLSTFWQNRLRLSLTGYDRSETLTNFPLCVVLSTNIYGFSYAQFNSPTNGGDLRFTGPEMVTNLNYEIEKWDTNGSSYVWVQVPRIAGSNDVIYAWWTSTNSTPPPCTTNGATWDTNYVGVWHMAQTNAQDSTTNARNGTAQGGVTLVSTGKVDGACEFGGTNDYVQVPSGKCPDSALGATYSVSAWVQSDPGTNWQGIVGTFPGSGALGFIFSLDNTTGNRPAFWANSAWNYGSTTVVDGVWNHVAYTRSVSSGAQFYLNGTPVTATTAGSTIGNSGGALQLGGRGDASYRFDGRLDEIEMQRTVRSSNWVWACWANTVSPGMGTMPAYGDVQPASLGVGTLPASGISTNAATFSGKVTSVGDAENPKVYLCVDYQDRGTTGTAGWMRVEYLGTNWGLGQTFSTNLVGLLSGSNYTYRCFATNSTGSAWSDTPRNFTTAHLPVAANLGPVNGYASTWLQGQIMDTGVDTPSAWFYWWPVGGATTTVAMGQQSGVFSNAISTLTPYVTYQYAVIASNLAGTTWSAVSNFQTLIVLPSVVNLGAADSGNNNALMGQITGTGGDVPTVWFHYWSAFDPTSVVPAGVQSGIFTNLVQGLVPNRTYSYSILISNRAGTVWSGVSNFTSVARAWYVATNGNGNGGTNWSTAYTNVQVAFNVASNGDTIYMAGHTFDLTNQFSLSNKASVSVLGGYAATSDIALPGPNDPAQWSTVFRRTNGDMRVLYLSGLTNSLFRGVTIRDGRFYLASNYQGAGAYVTACQGLTFDTCLFTNNVMQAYALGGGLYVSGSTILLTNCVFAKNQALGTANGASHGGGVYIASGSMTMVLCRVTGSLVTGSGSSAGASDGGGIYLAGGSTNVLIKSVISANTCTANGGGICSGGKTRLENCIMDHNNSVNDLADGIYASGDMTIANCTVADNGGVGVLYAGGTVAISNSIIWGQTDDLKSFPTDGQTPPLLTTVFYSDIYNGDNMGRQGCISIDPLFVNTNFYHLQSKQGVYTNGYFFGGAWGTALSNSPCIDAGDPNSSQANEPVPRGNAINLGAYGNTAVASLTDTTTVFTAAAVTNLGATLAGHRTARLNGQVTATGGQTPQCWAKYWITGDSSTSSVWAGYQNGVFSVDLGSLTPGSAYQYYLVASNAVGAVSSGVKAFATHPAGDALYVATNGNNTAGASWSTAYTNPQTAFDLSEAGDVVCLAGHTFSAAPAYQQNSVWFLQAKSNVTVMGGYAATNDASLPGANNPAQWPTSLKNTGTLTRVMYVSGLTNSLIRNVTLRDGSWIQAMVMQGGGMYATGCQGLTLDACTFTNNVVKGYGYSLGGGLYVNASVLMMTNCLFTKNTSGANPNSNGNDGSGGGVYVNSGNTTMVLCRVVGNIVDTYLTGSPQGGGLYFGAASTNVVRRTIISANSTTVANGNGGGIYNGGNTRLENCIVDHNSQVTHLNSDGICAGGNLTLVNCTIADNANGVGINYVGTSIAMTNTIVWSHADDLLNFSAAALSNVAYCCIKDGDGSPSLGCISSDPKFANTNYYHEESVAGFYTNGYFSGGGWSTNTTVMSNPTIDAGDGSDYSNEPAPNGGVINMGAYGNTEVASKTYTASVVTLPSVTNLGATLVAHRATTLNGLVTDEGGSSPSCWFYYWIVGSGTTSSVPVGAQVAGTVFSPNLSGLTPGGVYQFYILASNAAGSVVSDIKSFSMHPVPDGLYVATNGDGTAGASWSTAYTNLKAVLSFVESGDTIYLAGQTMPAYPDFSQKSVWIWQSNANVSLRGGYAASNDAALPGARDIAQWPTVLKNLDSAGDTRVMYISGVTNGLLEGVWIRDGYVSGGGATRYGGGMYIAGSTGLTLAACVITNNECIGNTAFGGGIYSVGSGVTLTNCLVTMNQVYGSANSAGYGGGLYFNGTFTVADCVIATNTATGGGTANFGEGGGIMCAAGSMLIMRRTLVSRNAAYGRDYGTGTGVGAGVFNAGSALVENCVIYANNARLSAGGDGLQSSGTLVVNNCTVANNAGFGVWVGAGTAALTNSILWGNGDDLTGMMTVAYCDVQTTDTFWTVGVNGCITNDPLFVDTTYFHEQSRLGVYTNGFFSGGGWSKSMSNSPCLDAGDPGSEWILEPQPHGRRANMGAYGNTSVASMSAAVQGSVFSFR